MTAAAPEEDGLDPGIRQFVSLLRRAAAEDGVPIAERRRLAEAARRPLVAGGPAPGHVRDYRVPVADGEVRVRMMNAAPGQRRPCLIYLHGGGWMLFSLETHDRVMRELAVRAGIAVAGVEYSLAPEATYPRQIDETEAVVHWLRARGFEAGVDREAIAIGGDSAGANLAVATCLRLRDAEEVHLVKSMLLCYGVYDCDFETASYRRYGGPSYNLGREEMQAFWSAYLGEFDGGVPPLAAPLRADLHGLPPAFMIIAERDVLYDENLAMARALADRRVSVRRAVYPGTSHSFLEAVSMAEVSGKALDDAAQWLRDVLRAR